MGYAFHLGKLGGGPQQGCVTTCFQKSGGFFHVGFEFQPLGTHIRPDFCKTGIARVGIDDVEYLAEFDAAIDQGFDLGIAGVAQLDPGQVGAASVVGAGLSPFGGVERTRR